MPALPFLYIRLPICPPPAIPYYKGRSRLLNRTIPIPISRIPARYRMPDIIHAFPSPAVSPSMSKRVMGVAYFTFSNLSPTCDIICTRMEYTTTVVLTAEEVFVSLLKQDAQKHAPPKNTRMPNNHTLIRRNAPVSSSPGKRTSLTARIRQVTYTTMTTRDTSIKTHWVSMIFQRF